MQVRFTCPRCGKQLQTEVQPGGKKVLCPGCSSKLMIPEARLGPDTVVGGFLVERKIGAGAMGEVYLATQLSMNRKVALKVLLPEMTANKEHIERFLHEVRILARIQHANIVTAFDAGEDAGNYYLAMSFVDGDDLDTILKLCRRMPEKEALQAALKVAGALAHVWENHGILHRDIKPSNIMLEKGGEVRLMDMGISKSMQDDGGGATTDGLIVGTPYYMSPEQAAGSATLDCRSDIYSLGATLYHLVTGSVAFDGDSLMGIVSKHLHEPLVSPRDRCPEVSANCTHLIEVMMAKHPDERPANWAACIADMQRVLKGQPPKTPLPKGRELHRGPSPRIAAMSRLAEQRKKNLHTADDSGKKDDKNASLLKTGILVTGILLLALLFLLRMISETGSAGAAAQPPPGGGTAPATVAETASAQDKPAPPNPSAKPAAANAVPDRERQKRMEATFARIRKEQERMLGLARLALLEANQNISTLYWEAKITDVGIELSLAGTDHLLDISPLRELPLRKLDLSRTMVISLAPLRGKDMHELHLANTQVSTLADLAETPIANLNLEGCRRLDDISALEAMPELTRLALPEHALRRNLRFIRDLPGPEYLGLTWAEAATTPKRAFVRKYFAEHFGEIRERQRPPQPGNPLLPENAPAAESAAAATPGMPAPSPLAQAVAALTTDIMRQDFAKARTTLAHPAAAAALKALKPADKSVLEALFSQPQAIMESFSDLKDTPGTVLLKNGGIELEVRSVEGLNAKAMRIVRHGDTIGRIGMAFSYADLDPREKIRRLPKDSTEPAVCLMRGLISLEAERPDLARKHFQQAGGTWGEALATALDNSGN